jgi:cold shock CspA family protein
MAMHFGIINAFTYNYPDKRVEVTILVHISSTNVFEFITLENNQIVCYEFQNAVGGSAQNVEEKIDAIKSQYGIDQISEILFYGDQLNKQRYLEYWEVGMIISGDSKRLNPLRLIDTDLEQRDKEYCERVFHLYAACIGGGLPTMFPVKVR